MELVVALLLAYGARTPGVGSSMFCAVHTRYLPLLFVVPRERNGASAVPNDTMVPRAIGGNCSR